MAFFSGFTQHRIRTTGATINAVSAGSGESVLLLPANDGLLAHNSA